jgi:hypothetical protein
VTATVEQIAALPGFSASSAQKLLDRLAGPHQGTASDVAGGVAGRPRG